MPLVIKGEGVDARPEHVDPVLPVCGVKVPSRREVLEALATVERLANHQGNTCPKSFELLRLYILTR